MKLALIFGAKSFEHEISIVSAIALKSLIDAKFVFCDQERNFYLIEKENMKANFFSSGKYKKSKKLFLSKGGFYSKNLFKNEKIEFDCIINLVHGLDGEDGKLSGIFDFYEIPYIGPRLQASVLSFNKELTKIFAKNLGINVLDYQVIKRQDEIKINYPFIVKPLRLGSSIGLSVVKNPNDLNYSLDVGFEFDDKLLIEPFISGVKEYNLAGFKVQGEFYFSTIEEPNKKEFLDYNQKYLSFSGDNKVKKANLSEDLERQLKSNFMKIYNNGFGGSIVRCDFFEINNEIYLNEINPCPGSLAYYLFEDFLQKIEILANNLPLNNQIKIDYSFINSINSSKGGKI